MYPLLDSLCVLLCQNPWRTPVAVPLLVKAQVLWAVIPWLLSPSMQSKSEDACSCLLTPPGLQELLQSCSSCCALVPVTAPLLHLVVVLHYLLIYISIFCSLFCSFFISCLLVYHQETVGCNLNSFFFFLHCNWVLWKTDSSLLCLVLLTPQLLVLEELWGANFKIAKVYSGQSEDIMHQITEPISKDNMSYRKLPFWAF